MTDVDSQRTNSANPNTPPLMNQRPSFWRWNDPIARMPFLGHWLLSLMLLVALPLAVLWLAEALGLGSMLLPLALIALLPAVQLYCVSVRRRLIGMGAKTDWLLLTVLFLAVSAFNALDGVMRSGSIELEQTPIINPMVNALLLLPAVVLHFVLLLRRGAPKSQATR